MDRLKRNEIHLQYVQVNIFMLKNNASAEHSLGPNENCTSYCPEA